MAAGRWSVLILDVKGSRRVALDGGRGTVELVRAAIRDTVRWQSRGFRLAPELLKGDEVQAVLHAQAPPLRTLFHLRAGVAERSRGKVQLWSAIGRGAIDRLSSKGPFESDGPAFHRARHALDSAKRAGSARQTAAETGDTATDRTLRAILGLLDALAARWTPLQWQGVHRRLEGGTMQSIAKKTDVSFQMVSKRLRAVSWNEVDEAITVADEMLLGAHVSSGASSTPRG